MDKYQDRQHAGQILASHLEHYAKLDNALILALPRGGVPIAAEIAKKLYLPLDILIVRKLGVPGHEELAMGAIALGENLFINKDILLQLKISDAAVNEVIAKEKQELLRRNALYRKNKAFPSLENKIILLVDDGIATGATVRAAIAALKNKNAAKIILVTPVMAKDTYEELLPLVNDIVCPLMPSHFFAVALWYKEFSQTSDNEVCNLLTEIEFLNNKN